MQDASGKLMAPKEVCYKLDGLDPVTKIRTIGRNRTRNPEEFSLKTFCKYFKSFFGFLCSAQMHNRSDVRRSRSFIIWLRTRFFRGNPLHAYIHHFKVFRTEPQLRCSSHRLWESCGKSAPRLSPGNSFAISCSCSLNPMESILSASSKIATRTF